MSKPVFYKWKKNRGFTLVEILVVVALIGILASVVMFSLSWAREQSKIAKVKIDLKSIELAFKMYIEARGAMPPVWDTGPADMCTICGWRTIPPTPTSEAQKAWWENRIVPVAQMHTDITIPTRDPWGRYYAYDSNYNVFYVSTLPSIVCSVGPDGVLQTWVTAADTVTQRTAQGDDICFFFREPDDTPW